jgi:putative ABC transport system permease protein
MTFRAGLGLAFVALGKNFLRSALAMVGLVIGVGAVVTMVALGRGARDEVGEEVGSAGTNLVFVRAGNYVRGGDAFNMPSGFGEATTLTADDALALAAIDGVRRVTPIVEDRAPFQTGDAKSFGPIVGCGPAEPDMQGLQLRTGRFFGDAEVASAAAVAVLGPTASDALFRGEDPVGKTLRIRDRVYTVVGTMSAGDATAAADVYVPFTNLQRSLGIDYLHGVSIEAETAGDASRVAEGARKTLRSRHGLDDPERGKSLPRAQGPFAMQGTGIVPDDFTVRTEAARALTQGLYTPAAALVLASMPRLDEVTSEEMVSTLARANGTMTLLLASIASVSLVVGGIGIMNVMLLSVTERTMEVGLRMSVGAKTRDVLLQFLLEAVALSVAGGILGVLLGFVSATILTAVLEWPTSVSGSAVALAFALALAVGVVFGYYPAYRASRLDPIDALRYE